MLIAPVYPGLTLGSNDVCRMVPQLAYRAPMVTREERNADPVRRSVGTRLQKAREQRGLSQDDVAAQFDVTKQTVSAWENGRGDPGIYRLIELCKLYKVSADALLKEDALSTEAMQFAAQFDTLNAEKKRTFKAVWIAFVQSAVDDGEVESKMPVTKREKAKPK